MDPDRSRAPADSLLEAIGGTPLVRLRRIAPEGLELFAKVEWYGPTGSVKDRIYAHMLGEAERRGDLQAGDDDHRVHDRQRGDRVCGRGGDQGLRLHDRDARGDELGAQGDDPRLRGRAGADAGRRDRHRSGARSDARHRRGRARPLLRPGRVREPGQPRGPGDERRRDLGASPAAGSTRWSPPRERAGGSPASHER